MTREPHLPDLLEAALAEHKTTRDLLDAKHNATGGAPPYAIHEILQLVNHTLVDHVAREERGIYAELVKVNANPAVKGCAAEIQEQHVVLLEKARRVNAELLQAGNRGALPAPQLQVLARDFVDYLLKHGQAEDVLFRFARHSLLPAKDLYAVERESASAVMPGAWAALDVNGSAGCEPAARQIPLQ